MNEFLSTLFFILGLVVITLFFIFGAIVILYDAKYSTTSHRKSVRKINKL
jgi:hypothetical protein